MGILNLIVILLLIFWVGGFALHVAGGLIHFLLVLALIIFLARFFRRTA